MAVVMLAGTTVQAAALPVAAVEQARYVQFKAGDVALTLLESNGVKPMAGAEVKMLSATDNSEVAAAVSDASGRVVVKLGVGRYLLNVAGRNLSVVEVTDSATLTECRVVVPERNLAVAGQEEEGSSYLRPVLIAGVVVLVALGIWALTEDDDDDDAPAPAAPAPTTVSRRTTTPAPAAPQPVSP
jgi:hypothetical protein